MTVLNEIWRAVVAHALIVFVLPTGEYVNNVLSIRSEAFTAVTMNNAVFWDLMPCGSCKNPPFG
jgi:hypothetical protein